MKFMALVQNQILIHKMGKNHSQISDNSPDFNYNQWEENTEFTQALGSEIGFFKTYKNKRTQQLVDCYQTFFPSEKDYEDYVDNFNWRLNEEDIINTKYLQPQIKTELCSTTYLAKVYIEHPKARLSDFKDIPSPDNLYCLSTMLDGFGKLFEKIGRFPIAEDQVAIDENGKIKVWLNSDFSKNYPSQFQIEFKHQTEEEMEELMVEEIVKMVALNTDQASQPQMKFIDFFQRQRYSSKMGFFETKNIIQEYAQINNLKVQDYFKSVVEIYNNQQEQEQEEAEEYAEQQRQDEDQDHVIAEIPQNNHYTQQPQPNVNNKFFTANQENVPTEHVVSGPFITNHSSQHNLFKPQLVSIHNSMAPPYQNIQFQQQNNVQNPNVFSFNTSRNHLHQPHPSVHLPQQALFRPSTQGYSISPVQRNLTPQNYRPMQYHEPKSNVIINRQEQQNLHTGFRHVQRQSQSIQGTSYVQPFFHNQKSNIKFSPSKATQPVIHNHQPFPTPQRIQNWSTIPQVRNIENREVYHESNTNMNMRLVKTNQFAEDEEEVRKERKFYYTVEDEVELDPQIAADLLSMI